MAAFEYSRPLAQGQSFSNRFTAIYAATIGALIEWNDARVTRNALKELSDHELDDIGLCRGDIDNI